MRNMVLILSVGLVAAWLDVVAAQQASSPPWKPTFLPKINDTYIMDYGDKNVAQVTSPATRDAGDDAAGEDQASPAGSALSVDGIQRTLAEYAEGQAAGDISVLAEMSFVKDPRLVPPSDLTGGVVDSARLLWNLMGLGGTAERPARFEIGDTDIYVASSGDVAVTVSKAAQLVEDGVFPGRVVVTYASIGGSWKITQAHFAPDE